MEGAAAIPNALMPSFVTSDCVTQPKVTFGDAAERSTGYLGCHAAVACSDSDWTIKVFAYGDEVHARAGYQRSCEAMKRVSQPSRWWTMWQQGQDWYAEVSATGGKAPRAVAEAFTQALQSTAWDDCSGLR